MEERPFSSFLGVKIAEMKQLTSSDNLQPSTNAYVKADAAVTQAILGWCLPVLLACLVAYRSLLYA
jgi:hypothetical protein